MPTDLLTGKTFLDLITDFAVAVRLATYGADGGGIPQAPTSEHDLWLCKRAVNQGYKYFLTSNADWTFCKHPLEMQLSADGLGPYNVDKDKARYRLPSFLRGQPRGNLRYTGGRTCIDEIVPMPAPVLERYRNVAPLSGVPTHFCVRPIDPTDPSGGKDFELVFYPSPASAYTIRGDWRVEPYDLRDNDERHIAGAANDQAILAAALHLFYLGDAENGDESQRWTSQWLAHLANSKALNAPEKVRNRGSLTPTRSAMDAARSTTRPFTFTLDGRQIPQ
jgi:hypothetical protein